MTIIRALVALLFAIDLWLEAHVGFWPTFLIELFAACLLALAVFGVADWLLGDWYVAPEPGPSIPYMLSATPIEVDGQGDLIVREPAYVAPSFSTPAAKGVNWRKPSERGYAITGFGNSDTGAA